MFVRFLGAIVLAGTLTIPSASAQQGARSCEKVDVTFRCGDIRGSMKFRCNAGESESDCCSRIKERLKRGSCKGKDLYFKCSCPKQKEQRKPLLPRRDRLRPPHTDDPAFPPPLPEHERLPPPPPRSLGRADSLKRGLSKPKSTRRDMGEPDSNRRQIGPIEEPPGGEIDPSDPPKGKLRPVPTLKGKLHIAACGVAVFEITCNNGARTTRRIRCTGNEAPTSCCTRVRMSAAKRCRRAGGVKSFKCDCDPAGKPSLLRR